MCYATVVVGAWISLVIVGCTNQRRVLNDERFATTKRVLTENILQWYDNICKSLWSKVTATPEPNTPANDHWYLSIGYRQENDVADNVINIAYLPDGSIDFTRTPVDNHIQASNLLQPLVFFMQSQTSPDIDIWKLLNALFVGYYWFILADLGQSSPTLYAYTNSSQYFVPSNFSQPVSYSALNNIIFNSTLANIVFGNIISNGSEIANSLHIATNATLSPDVDSRIRRIYLCTVMQAKPFVNLIVSVLGVGFGLILAFISYGLFMLKLLSRDQKWSGIGIKNNQGERIKLNRRIIGMKLNKTGR